LIRSTIARLFRVPQEHHFNKVAETVARLEQTVMRLDGELCALRQEVGQLRDSAIHHLRYYTTIPFNQQSFRKRMADDLLARTQPVAIVETGTHIGNTSQYFATKEVPLYGIELNEILHAIAAIRLNHLPHVEMIQGNSVDVLKARQFGDGRGVVFFYLDAHWYNNLPLNEEMLLVTRDYRRFVAMIDDFHVHDDPDYGFDVYPGIGSLSLPYVRNAIKEEFGYYYPACRGADEDSFRRGAIIICDPESRVILDDIATLRPVDPAFVSGVIADRIASIEGGNDAYHSVVG